MCESFRRYKSELRTGYYDKFDNDEARRKNCPPKVSVEDWDGFLKNEAKPGARERRELGKKIDHNTVIPITVVVQVTP